MYCGDHACCRCDRIGGKWYLRAQLTLECKGTRHQAYVAWASLMVLLFPVGVPLLLFGLMYPVRHHIKTLMQALRSQAAQDSSVTSVKGLSKRRASLAALHGQLEWLIKRFQNFQPESWCA